MNYTTAKQTAATIGKTVRSDIDLYTDVSMAVETANRRAKSAAILFESGYIVVCSRRAAENLFKAGYQYA